LVTLEQESRERTDRMLNDTVRFLEALAAQGISALLLKGAALAPCYYPDPLLRPMGDIDVLVHEQDVEASVEVLERLGYRFYSRSAEDVVYLKGERRANVWAPDNVHPLELHYTLREEYAGLAYQLAPDLWRSATKREYWRDTQALLPGTPALLHHVCAHATSDWLIQRGRLMHLGDLQMLAAKMFDEDWRTFLAGIDAYGARFIYPMLAFAVRYTDADIPAHVMARLAEQTPVALRDWIARTELGETSRSNPHPRSGLGLEIARWLARSRGERFRMWLRSFFPRRWNLTKRYPRLTVSPAWPLGYVLLNLDRARHIVFKVGD
jgi:hypothetical protein